MTTSASLFVALLVASANALGGFNIGTRARLPTEDFLNPVVMPDTLMWDGQVIPNVASAAACITQCTNAQCAIANYITASKLCLISANSKKVRRINPDLALGVKGGVCDAFTCDFKSNKLFLPGVIFEYSPGQNEIRSPQECFMMADLKNAPAFVFHNDDHDTDGKGNACTFYEVVNAQPAKITGFYSALNDGQWAPSVV